MHTPFYYDMPDAIDYRRQAPTLMRKRLDHYDAPCEVTYATCRGLLRYAHMT